MYKFLLLLLMIGLTSCSSTDKKEATPDSDSIFQSCMDTFSDEEKCLEMKEKANEKAEKKELEIQKAKRTVELTEEEEKNLWIREDLKNNLMMRNSLFVRNLLGEPDSIVKQSNGNVKFVYTKPISRYSKAHDPDKEISIIFVKFKVSKILHVPPDSTPESGRIFEKKIKRN